MNIFRLAGDMTHLASVLVLLLKIHTIKSCSGVSLKTQELYALVFATRYLDIFTDFVSLYNTFVFNCLVHEASQHCEKVSTIKTRTPFRRFFLVLPCLLLALLINENFTFKEKPLQYFLSLYSCKGLETSDNLTGQYVFFLGAYRGLYILNWVYRYFTEPHYVHWIPWISGLVQTLLYADFFYYYFDSWKNNKNLRLPA
ncbi:hypothetical protein CUMW_282200 [Citrus unshiu]|uniref:ER lumen protein-retaining receptor n=1 Tax=Citrus unshiu TaxID=55188 RepID=A0A2H5N0Q3_CITUN|nr:hypothetical protein CUMW_282200 [Citrus unshiu]